MELGKDTKDAAKFEKKQSRVKSRGIFWSQVKVIVENSPQNMCYVYDT